jgi:hypothetical protein
MKKIILPLIALIILAGTAGSSYYFYSKYQEAQGKLNNPDLIAQQEVDQIISKLSKLMDLPEGEQPTIATVLEKEKLMDQPFFQRSENGDKVIIYTKAAKAILYRPSANRIIEVAPIDITQPKADEAVDEDAEVVASPKPTPEPLPAVDDEEATTTE